MKQVIVVNESLKLPRGKLAAQVAHGSVASLLGAKAEIQKEWFENGMPKVVLAGKDEEEIESCYQKALDNGIPAYIVRDAGRTVVQAGTVTCVGIGPAPKELIDEVTGHLKLVK